MANYVGSCRSNYFRVKDETIFKQWLEKHEIGLFEEDRKGRKYFSIYPLIMEDRSFYPVDNAEWPTAFDGDDEFTPYDFSSELSEHLADGSVAILFSCGAMKMSLMGYAEAFNNKGEYEHIEIHDIFEKAKQLGGDIQDDAD